MPDPASSLADRIRQRLDATSKTPTAASKEAGLSASAIRNIFEGKSESPRGATLSKLAQVLGTTEVWLLAGSGPETLDTVEPVNFRPPPEILSTTETIPVFAAVEGGPGEMVVSTDAIDLVPRPWFLARVKEAYAVVVTGESMVPAFEPGQMALVNPKLPPLVGKIAIFVGQRDGGDFRATIKRLVRSTPTTWIVYQHNPPDGGAHQLELKKAEWPFAYRVVGHYDS